MFAATWFRNTVSESRTVTPGGQRTPLQIGESCAPAQTELGSGGQSSATDPKQHPGPTEASRAKRKSTQQNQK